MPSVEKCELKIAVYEGLKREILQDLVAREREWEQTTKGGIAALEAALEQLIGVHNKLDRDRDEQNESALGDDDYKLVKKHIAGDLAIIQKMSRSMRSSVAGSKPRLEGMGRVAELIDRKVALERSKIRQVEMEEKEEENYRRELEELQKVEEPPPVETAEEPPADLPEEERAPEFPACAHCGDPIDPPTGGKHCGSCMSYKNRFKKLPPEHVLEKRRAKKEEQEARGADS